MNGMDGMYKRIFTSLFSLGFDLISGFFINENKSVFFTSKSVENSQRRIHRYGGHPPPAIFVSITTLDH